MDTWRNLWRRRLRTLFTVLGIVVGTLGLTVMGAMSEKINLLVDGALKYYGTRIVVDPKASVPGQLVGPPLSVSLVETVKAIPGVAQAFPTVYMLYQENADSLPNASLGFPALVIGVDGQRFTYEADRYPVVLSSGQFFRPGDRGVAVIGVDLAKYKKAKLGGTLLVRGRPFRVVGIIAKTLTARDNIAFIPLVDAQELLAPLLPSPLNANPYAWASEIEVHPQDLREAQALAARITQGVPGVRAQSPEDIKGQFRQNLAVFNAIVIGSALIAVIVGGFSILNTMAMAVTERTREIGVKKAVGAANRDIMWEFLREAAAMGLLGGLVGLGAGALMVVLLNRITVSHGVVIFAITTRLAIGVVVFSTLLGGLAGLFPALAAARRRPIEALRAQ